MNGETAPVNAAAMAWRNSSPVVACMLSAASRNAGGGGLLGGEDGGADPLLVQGQGFEEGPGLAEGDRDEGADVILSGGRPGDHLPQFPYHPGEDDQFGALSAAPAVAPAPVAATSRSSPEVRGRVITVTTAGYPGHQAWPCEHQ